MNDDVQMLMELAEESMNDSQNHLKKELVKLRAGKANPRMFDGIKVNYYGTKTPLKQVANVGTTDARTIVIQPWEKSMLNVISKEIMKSNLGFNPINKGDILIINVPPLTEERRRSLVKFVKNECENCKISIRNARREAISGFKELKDDGLSEDIQKKGETDIQNMTNKFIKKINEIMTAKEKEIMTI